jgi:hypothetical protein
MVCRPALCWNGEGSFLSCGDSGDSSFTSGNTVAVGFGEASFLVIPSGTTSTTEVDFWIRSEPTLFISIMESDFWIRSKLFGTEKADPTDSSFWPPLFRPWPPLTPCCGPG